jgi:hypothetical protein
VGIRVGVGRDGQEGPGRVGKRGQIWEWVLEGPPAHPKGRERDTKSCDTHRLLLLFGWVQRLPGKGWGGKRKGYPGRGRGQGRNQDQKGRKSGQTRKDNRACVLVTDRAREGTGGTPCQGEAKVALDQGWRHNCQSNTLGNSWTSPGPLLGLGKELEKTASPNLVPTFYTHCISTCSF